MFWYNSFSWWWWWWWWWWWALRCSKHVEKWNKHIKRVRQVGYEHESLQRINCIDYTSPYSFHSRAVSQDSNSFSFSSIPCTVVRFPCRNPEWVSVHGTAWTVRRTSTYTSCKFLPLKASFGWLTRGCTFWTDPEDGGTVIYWSLVSSPNDTALSSQKMWIFSNSVMSTSSLAHDIWVLWSSG